MIGQFMEGVDNNKNRLDSLFVRDRFIKSIVILIILPSAALLFNIIKMTSF